VLLDVDPSVSVSEYVPVYSLAVSVLVDDDNPLSVWL
jgi:hypothetical protein